MKKLSRNQRNKDFNVFRDNFKSTFENFLEKDKKAKELKAMYSLYIFNHTPHSILDHSGVISYFGKKPYETVFRDKSQINLTEEGASFAIEKRDDGFVTIKLFPAKAESYQQKEDFIILDKKLNPKNLNHKYILKKYWYFFIAYMEVTSLDGSPSKIQLLTINYLRYFKSLIINNKFNNSRFKRHSLDISKFVLTVGLSGFLLLFFTFFFNRNEQKELKLFRSDFNNKINSTIEEFQNVKKNQKQTIIKLENAINENLKSTNKLLEKSLKNDTITNRKINSLIKNTTGSTVQN